MPAIKLILQTDLKCLDLKTRFYTHSCPFKVVEICFWSENAAWGKVANWQKWINEGVSQSRNELGWSSYAHQALKPKSSITSSSSIHMCLICNDFQMWVVWLRSLASSKPKMVFGIAQRTFYVNRRQTVIRRRGKGFSTMDKEPEDNLMLVTKKKTDYRIHNCAFLFQHC